MKNVVLAAALAMFSAALCAQAPAGGNANQTEEQALKQMQQELKEMQNLIAQIQSTSNPQQRRELMQEHMQSLDHGMMTMNRMTHEMMMGRGGRPGSGAGQCGPNDLRCRMRNMQTQQGMMGQRLGVMQGMMAQMMQQMLLMEQSMRHMSGRGAGRGAASGRQGAPPQ